MALNTYGAIKTAARLWLSKENTPDADLDFAMLAFEARANNTVRAHEMLVHLDNLNSTGRYTTLPTDFLEMHRIVVIDGQRRYLPEYATSEYIAAIDVNSSALPCFYNIAGNEIELTGQGTVVLDLHYYGKQATLTSSDSAQHAMLVAYPDLYLYGMLMELAAMYQSKQRMATYGTRYEIAKSEIGRKRQAFEFGVPGGMGRSV